MADEFQVCKRCLGTGRYSYNQTDGSTCYGCNGLGKVPTLPEKTAKTMKLICNTEKWNKYTFKNGDQLKAKFCNLTEETKEPVYMVSDKWGTGFKFKLSSIEKNCIIL